MKKYLILLLIPLFLLTSCKSTNDKVEDMGRISKSTITKLNDYYLENNDMFMENINRATNDSDVKNTSEQFKLQLALILNEGYSNLSKNLDKKTTTEFKKYASDITKEYEKIDYQITTEYYNYMFKDMGFKTVLTPSQFNTEENLIKFYKSNGIDFKKATDKQVEISNDFIKYKDDMTFRFKKIDNDVYYYSK